MDSTTIDIFTVKNSTYYSNEETMLFYEVTILYLEGNHVKISMVAVTI